MALLRGLGVLCGKPFQPLPFPRPARAFGFVPEKRPIGPYPPEPVDWPQRTLLLCEVGSLRSTSENTEENII